MRSRKLLALIFSLLAIAPALAGYMTLLGAGVGSIQPVASWVSTTDPTFPSSSLTYSGPSLSTMFDSTGKLTYKPNNLLTYSNTFSDAAWTKATMTVVGGFTDPLGGSNATRLTATGATSFIYQNPTVLAGLNVLTTIWVKRVSGSGVINLWTLDGATGTVIVPTGTWTQYTVSGTSAGSAYSGIIIQTSGDVVDIYAPTASAVTYETTPRTDDQVITTSAAYYGPRIDYDPNTLAVKGLLIEEARTNLALQSNDLTTGSWPTSGVSKSTDGTLGPDGKSLMVKTLANAGGGQHEIYQSFAVTSGVSYASSIFVKKGNYRYVAISFEVSSGSNGFLAVFDLDNPSAATQSFSTGASSLTTYGIINCGGGIYRIYVAGTAGASGTGYLLAHIVSGATIPTGSVEPTNFVAAGTEYAYFFGSQLEVGSFSTSYIPTAASSVTRAADVVQFTGAALAALQGSAGSAIVQTSSLAANSAYPQTFIGTQNISFTGNSLWYWPASTKIATANASQNLSTTNSPAIGSPLRAGVAWSGAGRSVAANGVASATDANPFVSTAITSAYLGSANGGTLYWLNGWVQSFAIYNQRLSDATLQARSVVGASYAANDNATSFTSKFATNDNLPVHWRIAL